jgi:hypothetical protein
VILLLDEQLDSPDQVVARSLNIIGASHGCSFRSLRLESPGLKDLDIPEYCRREGIDGLISANVRDFGAKLALYEALLAAGVSVVVIRPQARKSLSVEHQASLLAKHIRTIARDLQEAAPTRILLRVNESGCVKRSLSELHEEIGGEGRLP